MSYAYIRPLAKHGGMFFVEIIKITPDDTVPPRPTPPGGGDGDLGIWGPTDPRPTHPIFGFDPIHGTWPDRPPGPTGPTGPGVPEGSKVVMLSPVPEGETPPAAPPADAAVMKVNMGPGTTPTYAWVAPYAQQLPT
jgi:hypothetical protein